MPTYVQRLGASDSAPLGPFRGPIAFGSDEGRCQLVVDRAADIRPVHATLGPLRAGQHTLAPADPGCRVYLRPVGKEKVWEVDSPVSAKVGSTVYLGSPEGPAFVIQHSSIEDAPVSDEAAAEMMGALDRALGPQVRALDESEEPEHATPAPEVVPEALLQADTGPHPLVGCAVAALSGMVVGGLAFGAATLAVLQAFGTSG